MKPVALDSNCDCNCIVLLDIPVRKPSNQNLGMLPAYQNRLEHDSPRNQGYR